MTVGIVGLGHMGGAIAERLLTSGASVVAYDISTERQEHFRRAGADVADSVRGVAQKAAIVLSCLPSIDACVEAARAVAGSRTELLVEMSTIGRSGIGRLATELAGTGVELVDAPVSGGPRAALEGRLPVMLAGSQPALARVREVLAPLGSMFIVAGDTPGQAQMCKLVNNAISFTAFLVSCEAMAVGVAAGVNPGILIDVLNAGSARNSATVDKIPRAILTRRFDLGGVMASGFKDLDLYLDEAAQMGMPPTMVAATRKVWADAVAALDGTKDFSHMIEYFEGFTGARVAFN